MRNVLLVALLLLPRSHPLHTTHTELTEDPDGRITLVIRAFTDDLHAAAAGGDPVTDSVLAGYVRRTVRLTGAGGTPVALHWVSAELDGDVTRLQFRALLPRGLAGAALSQAMQAALFADQVNVVQARYARRRVSLLFVPGDGAKLLP